MDEEEVVTSQQEQVEEQPQAEKPQKQRQTVKESLDNVQQGINDVGKTVENVGKVEEKAADFLDGGEKAAKGAANVGSATSSAVDAGSKATEGAAKVQKGAAQAQKAAAEATKAGAEATKAGAEAAKAGAKAGEIGGKAVSSAGEAINAAGTAADAAYGAGVGANVAGTAMNVGGKIAEAAATATEAGADATIAGAEATKAGAEAAKGAADAQIAAADAQIAGAKAAQTASKTGKEAANAGKKATDKSFADKLRERGKLNQARGKRIQDLSKKFDSEKVFNDIKDKFGKAGKLLEGAAKLFDPKTIVVILLLFIICATLLVSYILSPLFFMQVLKGTVGDPDQVEKANNFMAGLGFRDSEEAFYSEVSYLTIHYGDSIDFPYIMATLYYPDTFLGDRSAYTDDNSNVCENLNLDDEDDAQLCSYIQIGINFAKAYLKEAKTTTGSDGLVYSANKLYRLRDLAKHQFLGSSTKTTTLSDYIALCNERMANEFGNILEYIPLLIVYAIAYSTPAGTIFMNTVQGLQRFNDLIEIVEGTENWNSLHLAMENGDNNEIINALKNLLSTLFGCFFEIKDVSFDVDDVEDFIGDIISSAQAIFDSWVDGEDADYSELEETLADFDILDCIEIEYLDGFDEEKFEEYLVDEYIRKMPEFSKMLLDANGDRLTGDALDEKVDKIAYDIKLMKDMFDSIYEKEESAQEYGKCIGDIDLDLLTELTPPVNLTMGQEINFFGSNNYGLQLGRIHNGVDLEESSTNTKQGDPVYSIYDGKVAKSTADGTYDDPTAKGGWLAIDYTVQYVNKELGNGKISNLFKNRLSKIRVYYGGLDTSTLTLKQNDVVAKGQIIGNVGDATMSETGDNPSVHFAIYDVKNRTFLNPINMFITCNAGGTGLCYYDASGGLVIEIPDSVMEYRQTNYTVTCYNDYGWVKSGDNGYTCKNESKINSSSDQKKVHELWTADGARYKNGIAVLKVNGVDRYLVAVTAKFGKSGELINANLEDGTVLEMIVADTKSYGDTGVTDANLCDQTGIADPGCYGHYDGSISVLEFEVDPDMYNNNTRNPSAWGQEWDTSQKVVSIARYGSILGSTEDTTGICSINYDNTILTADNPADEPTETHMGECSAYTTEEGCNQGTKTYYCKWLKDYSSQGGHCSNDRPKETKKSTCASYTTEDGCNLGTNTYTCQWVNRPGSSEESYCKNKEKITRECSQFAYSACPKVDDYGNPCTQVGSTYTDLKCKKIDNPKRCKDYSTSGMNVCNKTTDDYGSKCRWTGSACTTR